MFAKTTLKLTFFYSLLFLTLFWIFSLSLYFWMERSFGEDYISQVYERRVQQGDYEDAFEDNNTNIVTISGDVALDRLKVILLIMNGVFLLVIPIVSNLLAHKSLKPIHVSHNKQKQFVSDAAHELRTPLSIMMGEIDVALAKDRGQDAYKEILVSNKEELKRLTSLVENLLFLARDDQNRPISFSDEIELTDMLAHIVAQTKPIWGKKLIKVNFNPGEENIVIRGNRQNIYQLFLNLIDNAVKYTNKGEVNISIKFDNKYARVIIKDTGIGISDEVYSKLFDRFFRVENSRSEIRGYGLGLAICDAIVKRHNGRITLTSALNEGSTFTVLLPLKHS